MLGYVSMGLELDGGVKTSNIDLIGIVLLVLGMITCIIFQYR